MYPDMKTRVTHSPVIVGPHMLHNNMRVRHAVPQAAQMRRRHTGIGD
jgi:hypothetical protein